MTESQFQATVVRLARLAGFRMIYHTHNSKRSAPGFPDLVLVKPPRVVFAELKSATGRLSPEQVEWASLLHGCPGVEMYEWRPRDLQTVAEVFAGTHAKEAACPPSTS